MINQLKGQWLINIRTNPGLSFSNCVKETIDKTLKGASLLRKLSTLLPWQNLFTVYKSFPLFTDSFHY